MESWYAGIKAGVQALGKRLLRNDIESPAGVSGTGPTVAEQDCQQEDKDQDESQPSKRQRHDDGFITAPTSPTADSTSNLGDLITSKEDEAMVDEQDNLREQASDAWGKRDSILQIMRYINDGAGNNTHLQHKRHGIVLGLTGSGKSTTINSLAGCKLRRVTEEEAIRFECSRRALVVASGGERCGRKEVTKIGSRSGKSQTKVLQAVAVDEKDDGTQGMEMEQEELGGVGLDNLGNTCYMAAFLQVLVRAHSFAQRLLKLPRSADTAVVEGVLDEAVLQELQRMMAILLLSKRRSLRSEGLLSALRRKAESASLPCTFQEGHQQDAGEAGLLLFSCVDASPSTKEMETKPTRVFQGKMRTRVTCKSCGRESCRSEEFYDLKLPIPSASDGVNMSGQEVSLSLEGLVSAVWRKEDMCGANQYECDNCGCKQDAVKESLLEELPEILLITLLRFDHTSEKVCTFVEIPPSLSLRSGSPSTGAPEEQAAVQYELFGVVTHEGSTRQAGHYYSFVRQLNETYWLRCDDSKVSGSSFQRAVNPELPTETPYLLFYMRNPALPHTAAAAEATIHAIPPMLHREVEEDNRLARAGMILWDAPGFVDSNGPEQNIANAVNLQRLLKASSHPGSSLAVLVVLDAPSLDAGRGELVKRTLDMLSQLFGGRTLLKSKLESLVFCITKADRPLATLQNLIVRLAGIEGISLKECRDRMVLYDPLSHDDQDKKALTALLRTVTPVGENAFQTSLDDRDKELLCVLADECSEAISDCMAASNAQGALEHWESLEKLNVIQHPAFDKAKEGVRKRVVDLAKEWRARVRMLHTDHTAKGREEVKRLLELLKAGCIFCRVATGEADELGGLDKEYRELVHEAKFRDAIFIDLEINEAASGRGVGSSRLQFLWSHASLIFSREFLEKFVSHCKEGRDILAWFGHVENIAKERREQCVNSDQCNLAALLEQKREEVLKVCQGMVSEIKLNRNIRECVRELEQHSDAAVEAKGSELCVAGPLSARDVVKLLSLGFDKDAEQKVKLLRELRDEATGLQAFVAATRQVDGVVSAFLAEVFRRASSHALKRKAEESLKLEEEMRRVQHRNSIERRISSILLAPAFKTMHNELRDAVSDLQRLGSEGEELYEQALTTISKKLKELHSPTEVDKLIRFNQLGELADRGKVLSNMSLALKDFLEIDSTALQNAVIQQLDILTKEAETELQRDVDDERYLSFSNVQSFLKIQSALSSIDPKRIEQAKQNFVTLAQNNIKAMVQKARVLHASLGGQAITPNITNTIAKILIKGYAVAVELFFVDDFKKNVRKYLFTKEVTTSHDIWTVGQALWLHVKSSDSSVSSMARAIIEGFSEFTTIDRQIFNEKAGCVDFQQALGNLNCEPPRPQNSNLSLVFDSYNTEYEKEVNRIIQLNKENAREKLKAEMDQRLKTINDLANILKSHRTSLGSKCEEFGKFLGLICAQYSYMESLKSEYGLEKEFLLQPHDTQILGIMRLLGVDDRMENHLIQINTGEGKSIALGFTAIVLAKLGYQVDVVCYSEYLSVRDFDSFENIFERLDVLEQIQYSDFKTLLNRILSAGEDVPNIRETFKTLILRTKVQQDTSLASLVGWGASKNKISKILLLDEVDVFFSDSFYGRLFRPSVAIDAEESFGLVKHVWDNRRSLSPSQSDVEKLIVLPETSSLMKKYPGLSKELLQRELMGMLEAASKFPEGKEPRLHGSEHKYVIHDGRIEYIEAVSGVRSSIIVYGYTTSFTYFMEYDKKRLSYENIKEYVKMSIVCGGLLYSMIPTYYDFCLGMTGTLDCLTCSQNSLLQEYNFKRRTYLPSTFNKKALNETQVKNDPESVKTKVVIGTWEDYFQALVDEIKREFIKGRAILIVWEDEEKLNKFDVTFRARHPVDHIEAGDPLKLIDEMDQDERQSVVIQATTAYSLTLLSRSYGRGTDLVCRDNRVTKDGGVHLILTFFPHDDSESKQIFGRTCRQDDPGSCRIILFEPDLEYLSATEVGKNNEGSADWDPYLKSKRHALLERRFDKMRERQNRHKPIHDLTLSVCKAVQAMDWGKAESQFLDCLEKM